MVEYRNRREVLEIRSGPTTLDRKALEKIVERRRRNPKVLENERVAQEVAAKARLAAARKENNGPNFKEELPRSEGGSHPLDFMADGKNPLPADSVKENAPKTGPFQSSSMRAANGSQVSLHKGQTRFSTLELDAMLRKVFTHVVRHHNHRIPTGSITYVKNLMGSDAAHKHADYLLTVIGEKHGLVSSNPHHERRLVSLMVKHALETPERINEWITLMQGKRKIKTG